MKSKCKLRNNEISQSRTHWFFFSFYQRRRRGGLCFFCSLSLIRLSSFPAIHSPGTYKDCPSNKRSRCLSGPSVRLLKERRQQERSREAVRTERREEERREVKGREGKGGEEKTVQFYPPQRSPAAPCSQYPTSRRPYSETHLMNTPALIQPHNGALHSH